MPNPVPLFRIRLRRILQVSVSALFATAVFAAEPARRAIDLPAGPLEQSLKGLASQAGIEIVFSPEVTDGIRTSSLKGEFTALEAANRLLAGTNLYIVNNERTGVLSVVRAPPAEKNVERAAPVNASGRPVRAPKRDDSSAPDDQAVELSPFTIVAERETGWVANQTLAGSRMKTEFKDIAQPLEVMTKDFMNDLAVNNFEQALVYSTNVTGPQEYADNSNNNGIGFANQQPKNDNLMRGLAGATNSVDFFESSMPSDGYNIERLTIARGPNAVLFGLGSPSGIVDSTLKRGLLNRNLASVQLQITSDNSKRGAFDINRVILKDRLALRFDGMTDEGITHIKPNLDRQTRLYGAVTAKPFASTTITTAYEHSFWNSNRAKSVLPVDSFSPWLNASRIAGSPYTTNKPLFDNSKPLPANFNNNPIFTGPPNNSNLVMTYGGLGVVADGDTRRWNNSVSTRGLDSIPAAINPLNSFDRFTLSLLQDNPVPFDTNVFGSQQFLRMRSDDWHVYIEQKLAKNLFLEGAWFHQGYFEQLATSGFAGLILLDANQFLPDQVTPNPNVGRYYTQRNGAANGNQEYEEKRDAYRATLSYELDLRHQAGWLGKWILGRLRPVAMMEQDNFRRRGEQYTRGILENPTITGNPVFPTGSVGTGRTGTGSQNWATNVQRDVITRFYLGGPAGNAPGNPFGDLYGTWNFKDATGKPYSAYTAATPYTSVEGWPLARSSTGAEGSKQRTDTLMFAMQDYVLDERLVLLFGYRKDKSKSASLDPKYLNQDWSGMFPTWRVAQFGPWGASQSGATRTYGVVAHFTPWLSGLFNRSNTFQPNIGKFDPFGNEYPGSTGKATDYGLNFDLLQDRLRVRVSHYENTNGPIRAGNSPFQDPVRDNLLTIDQNIMTLDPSIPRLNAGAGGYRELGRANYWVMLDNSAKGYELDVSFRPTPNWDIILNGAKNKTVQGNIGRAWFDWINARLPVWKALNVPEGGKSTPRDVNGDGRVGTWTWSTAPFDFSNGSRSFEQYYNETIVAQSLNLFQAYEGTAVDQGREYRGNVITQYRFTEGRLKGFSGNLAFRYRAAPTLGYAVTTGAGGVLLLDPTKPIRGPQVVNTDAGISYRGRIPFFNDIKYRAQLNVRNLFNEWTLVPVKALSTGQFGRYNRLAPRTYVFTTTFEY